METMFLLCGMFAGSCSAALRAPAGDREKGRKAEQTAGRDQLRHRHDGLYCENQPLPQGGARPGVPRGLRNGLLLNRQNVKSQKKFGTVSP